MMSSAAEPALTLDVPLDVEVGWGAQLGRRALTARRQPPAGAASADLAALARGGRINLFGFVLRLAARLPFLFIAGRIYGAEALGRFAYAVLIVEFAAQLATLGPEARARPAARPHRQAARLRRLGRAAGRRARVGGWRWRCCSIFPQAMFPNSEINGLEWLLADRR